VANQRREINFRSSYRVGVARDREAGLEAGEIHAKMSPSSTSELSYRVWGLIVGMFLSE
jgi:hypothetical protein